MSKTVRKKTIELTEAVDRQRRASGEVWSRLTRFWHRMAQGHGYYMSRADMEALFGAASMSQNVKEALDNLPVPIKDEVYERDQNPFVNKVMRMAGSQQRQQTVQRFHTHVNTFFNEHLPEWKENGKPEGEKPSPPKVMKKYSRVDWVHDRIEKDGTTLTLKTGRGEDPIDIDEWTHPEPQSVQIIREDGKTKVCAQYDDEKQDLPDGFIRDRLPMGDKTAGVDLGEVYLATAYDGEETILIDGGEIRKLRKIQNAEKEEFSSRIDRKEKGSNRSRKLKNAKKDRLQKIQDKIRDVIHKMSTRLVEELWSRGVETIVIGDITDIREDIDFGADTNRRLHQWAFREFTDKVTYKAERYGMTVTSTREAFTSQTCPSCGTAKKSHKKKRGFSCSQCDFEAHRDQVGAMNIREKHEDPEGWSSGYLKAGTATATGDAESPTGSPTGRQTKSRRGDSGEKRRRESAYAAPSGGPATPHARSPITVEYQPHMDCVFDPDELSQG